MAQGRDPSVGRWASGARRDARRDQILDATLAVLEENGYAGTSMQKVARAARMSKETLYAWFGDRAGLFEALVAREAQAMNDELRSALDTGPGREPRAILARFGADVLELLLGRRSLTINRAAIAAAATHPELGRILAATGRESIRPLVEAVLAAEHTAGRLHAPVPGEAFELLMGLLVRDLQVRLLAGGGEGLDDDERRRRARIAVDALYRLSGP